MLRLFWRCGVLVGLLCLLCLCGASRAENLRKDAPSAPLHYFLPENLRKDYAAQRVVRVGWFDQHAVFKEDGGKVCGYAPALLEAISRYTGWRFEWIPIPFEELADKLNNGDIDISCGISYTPERAQQMTFSKLQAGFEITTLHVPQQSNVHFMDFKDFDGMRLGFYSGAYDQDIFRRMGRQFGFDFTIVEFDESLPMLRAVQDGSVDGYVDGCLSGEQTKVAGTFAIEPFYFVSRKGDAVFMPRIDEAIRQMQITSPRFFSALFDSFLNVGSNVAITLSRGEEEWLAGKPVLRMAYSREQEREDPRRGPFLQRLSLELARRAGIRLEMIPADNYEESLAMLRRGEADLVSNVPPSADFARRFGIFVGQPFYNAPISLAVTQNARPGTGLRIATTPEFLSVQESYLQTYPSDRFVLYSTLEQCCEAVSKGEADAHLTAYPGLTSPAGLPRRHTFAITQAFYPMAYGFGPHVSPYAISIFDKNILALSGGQVETLVMDHVPQTMQEMLINAVHRNILWIIAVCILLGALLFWSRGKANRKHLHDLEKVAYTDSVTGGINRARFLLESDEQLLDGADGYVVVSINIRKLVQINRSCGYGSGDWTIRRCYAELQNLTSGRELVAHVGGGRFLCLWHCEEDRAVESRLNTFFHAGAALGGELGHALVLSCGIARIQNFEGRIAPFVVAAETAQTSIGDNTYKSSYAFYDTEMDAIVLRMAALENRMQSALGAGEFVVHVQPQIQLASGNVSGGEALVRWMPPDGSKIYPDEFIPLFEKNGFIRELDIYVLDRVCRWLRQRLDEGRRVVPIGVNQSRALFLTDTYCEQFISVLERHNIPHDLVEVEVTESLAGFNEELVVSNLQRLKTWGIKVALDDFGKGYSSLAALQLFPVDVLKLDKEFLSAKSSPAMLESLVHLGSKLGLKVLCEGIETLEQLRFLAGIGCTYGQGYYIARPMPFADFETFLAQRASL